MTGEVLTARARQPALVRGRDGPSHYQRAHALEVHPDRRPHSAAMPDDKLCTTLPAPTVAAIITRSAVRCQRVGLGLLTTVVCVHGERTTCRTCWLRMHGVEGVACLQTTKPHHTILAIVKAWGKRQARSRRCPTSGRHPAIYYDMSLPTPSPPAGPLPGEPGSTRLRWENNHMSCSVQGLNTECPAAKQAPLLALLCNCQRRRPAGMWVAPWSV